MVPGRKEKRKNNAQTKQIALLLHCCLASLRMCFVPASIAVLEKSMYVLSCSVLNCFFAFLFFCLLLRCVFALLFVFVLLCFCFCFCFCFVFAFSFAFVLLFSLFFHKKYLMVGHLCLPLGNIKQEKRLCP